MCATLPTITRLSDFAHQEAAVATLHAAMCQAGKVPSAAVLGAVGRAHFQACFERWYGVQRFWYDTKTDVHQGIPFIVEVAVAETVDGGELWTGINFSPTFEDPLAQTYSLRGPRPWRPASPMCSAALHALPGDVETPTTAVAVHLVCPTLEFLDRGKTRLKLPYWMADLVAKALKTTTKTLYQEGEQRRKNAAKAARQAEARERAAARQIPVTNVKEAVFAVLPEAWRHATGDGRYRVSARFLFYPVRKLIQALTVKPLDYDYFSQTLVIEYQRQGGQLPGLYYDPRGVLYEPHTGRAVALGTQEVEAYTSRRGSMTRSCMSKRKACGPSCRPRGSPNATTWPWSPGRGMRPRPFGCSFRQQARIGSINSLCCTMRIPTATTLPGPCARRPPGCPGMLLTCIDLGLRWEDAMALGLDTEEFTRRRALPEGLVLTRGRAPGL